MLTNGIKDGILCLQQQWVTLGNKYIKTSGIRWSRCRWLGALQSSDKSGFGPNEYFKEEF